MWSLRRPHDRRPSSAGLICGLVLVAALVLVVQGFSSVRLAGAPSFVPAMLALVGCLDILSAGLLMRQFRGTGDLRALALAWAYVFSLVVLAGYGAAFPGVVAPIGPLGHRPSTAPWLWVIWHTAFPLLLGASLAPWPRRWGRTVSGGKRLRFERWTVLGCVVAGALVVWGVVAYGDRLPVIIHGLDTSAMTRVAGPVMVPLVLLATVVAVCGSLRRTGPQRWAGLAAAAALGDVILTLFSDFRFSLGWYVGRSLTVVSCAVVLIAMLVEFGRLERRLVEEAERLAAVIDRSLELERLQETLLEQMPDGVMLQAADGRLLARNPAVDALVSRPVGDLIERMTSGVETEPFDEDWPIACSDGSPMRWSDFPAMAALRTGQSVTDVIVGVESAAGGKRWLRMSAAISRGDDGDVRYVLTSMTDVTDRHSARLTAIRHRSEHRVHIDRVLVADGPTMVIQPIADLMTGEVVGGEALARFPFPPHHPPDVWFSMAAKLGIGEELELSAVRAGLRLSDSVAAGTYVSLNVSPATAVSPQLPDLLSPCAERIVLELTEHANVDDYPTLLAALEVLRAAGVRLAVDDAGSGFSSLRHILNLRPDVIKLDLALVRGIDADPARRALASSLLVFAGQIGADLVAEGIETQAELAVLRDIGIAHGQGYLLGRPAALPLPLTVRLPAREEGVTQPGAVGVR
jgi:EAL domain-containing protein (putative c-di-GMP-specific phosphodiesterase class I)/PAS domain-containing protein